MKIEYERAYTEAGMDEEQIKELRRFFDAEKKKLKRRNRAIERMRLQYFSLTVAEDLLGEGTEYEIPDTGVDVEGDAIHGIMLGRLREVLAEMSPEDTAFLQICFGEERPCDSRIAKRLGISCYKVRRHRTELIELLREKMGIEN